MRFVNARNRFLWATCLALLLAVPAGVWADKDKNTNSSPPPKQAPAQRPAPTINKPSGGKPTPNVGGKPNPNVGGKPNPNVGKPNPKIVEKSIGRSWPTTTTINGHTLTRYPSGRTAIQTSGGATVYRSVHGVRGVHELPGGRHVEFTGRNYGHMERNYARGYRMRTYYEHGRYRAVVYRSYLWRGRPYYIYAPYYYYRPVFYGWAYNPWVAPAYYQWGWFGDPWYPYYGYYFAPAPFYPGASLWLTDFILAENLKMAYDAQQSAVGVAGPPAADANAKLTPEVKQMIAEEVKQQLMAEKAEAARTADPQPTSNTNGPPPALDPNRTVFVVASTLDVATPAGDCELTPGDVINRIDDTPDSDGYVQVRVAASKQGDCRQGSKPAVKVADLQDMSNRFREQLDEGLKQLAQNQGRNDLPAAPDTSTTVDKNVPTPEPDKDVYAQIQGLQKEADQAEQDVRRGSSSGQTGGQ